MKLLTQELRTMIPELYKNENVAVEDQMVICKYFTPWSNWTWYVTEFDGNDDFFGLVDGLEKEFGYFGLKELESIAGPFGLRVERDIHFKPCLVKEVL